MKKLLVYTVPKILEILYIYHLRFIIYWSMHLDALTINSPYGRFAGRFLLEKGDLEIETIFEKWILKMLEKQGSETAENGFKQTFQESCFVEAMGTFFSITEEQGFKPFLCFGSLLGYVREGKFISWDRDLDICFLLEDTDIPFLKKTLVASGFKIILDNSKDVPYKMKCQLSEKHPPIDMAFFKKEGEKLLTYASYTGTYLVRYRTPFVLEKKEYYGVKINIPQNPEVFLTENYGDWETPKCLYHYILDSKLTDFTLPAVRVVAKEYFLQCLIKKDRVKALHYLKMFNKKIQYDPFWQKVTTYYEKNNLY